MVGFAGAGALQPACGAFVGSVRMIAVELFAGR